jgi:hypothetical protein
MGWISPRGLVLGLLAPRPGALPRIEGPAFVLGSAPNPVPPRDRSRKWTLATVNGSQVVAAAWGLEPEITLFGLSFVHTTPANAETRKVLSGKRTRQLLCIGARKHYFHYRRVTRQLGYGYDRLTTITPKDRADITRSVIGVSNDETGRASNGIFLAILCLHLGASEVVMGGFSLTQHGHAYNDKGHFREHIDADRAVLARAAKAGLRIATNDPRFSAESGLPLVEI